MKIARYTRKFCRLLPFLASAVLCGCVNGPLPKGAWPWEYGGDYGKAQTGDYFAVSGNVGQFGEAPQSVKPVTSESLETHAPEAPVSAKPPATAAGPDRSPVSGPSLAAKAAGKLPSEYDFSLSNLQVAPPSYLPVNSTPARYDLTAFNRGDSPVSVAIAIDPEASHNFSSDQALPLNAVLAPNTDKIVLRSGPKNRQDRYALRYRYSWTIGDYTARHLCREHYRVPFGGKVKGVANVSNRSNTVRFSLPAGTPVLAARKGKVIQIKSRDEIDILHDDSTIATYRHLGAVSDGVSLGKEVSTEDVLGTVGAIGKQKEGYLQLTVWRPEPRAMGSLKTSVAPGFDFVSFPLEFCSTGSTDCKVLTQDQLVSRNSMKKEGKNKAKSAGKTGRI